MEPTIDKKQSKLLSQKSVIELAQEQHDLFTETGEEAVEETGMVRAIREGR